MAKSTFPLFVATGLLVTGIAFTVPTAAQEQTTKVLVQVDGLSCPFCSFGLEKKLKKLEGVEAVTIKPDEAVVELVLKPGAVIHQNKIREAVVAGGFTPGEIRVETPATEPQTP
jgi:copper chaperone CopZ